MALQRQRGAGMHHDPLDLEPLADRPGFRTSPRGGGPWGSSRPARAPRAFSSCTASFTSWAAAGSATSTASGIATAMMSFSPMPTSSSRGSSERSSVSSQSIAVAGPDSATPRPSCSVSRQTASQPPRSDQPAEQRAPPKGSSPSPSPRSRSRYRPARPRPPDRAAGSRGRTAPPSSAASTGASSSGAWARNAAMRVAGADEEDPGVPQVTALQPASPRRWPRRASRQSECSGTGSARAIGRGGESRDSHSRSRAGRG